MALSDNMKGAIMLSVAMACFTCNDAFVKSVTPAMNTGQILLVRGILTTALVFLIAWRMGALCPLRTIMQPMVIWRTLAEICASLTYIYALASTELANAASIMQALPLTVTLGAALFFSEPVGWRRWLAIFVGFIGVLFILRPGPEGFSLASLMVVVAVTFTTARDLLTRRIHAHVPALMITLLTSVANSFFGALLIVPMGGWQPMDFTSISHLVFAAVFVLIGYQAIIMAMRTGEISFIAPFRYTGMIWALLIAIFFFGEVPSQWTLIGAAIVVCSGLYTFYRENKRKTKVIARQPSPVTPQ